MNLSEQQPASCDWWWKVGRYEHVCDEGCRQQNLTADAGQSARVEAAAAAMEQHYEDREWPAPGGLTIRKMMVDVLLAADAALVDELGQAKTRLAEIAVLHQPQQVRALMRCKSCDESWPCPTAAAMGVSDGAE